MQHESPRRNGQPHPGTICHRHAMPGDMSLRGAVPRPTGGRTYHRRLGDGGVVVDRWVSLCIVVNRVGGPQWPWRCN